jgi:hypothetical protein
MTNTRHPEISEIEIEQTRVKVEAHAAELDRLYKEVAGSLDSTRLANITGKSYQYVRMILNTNGEQRPFPPDMVPALMTEAPDLFSHKIINWFCDHCSLLHPEPKRDITPKERLEQLNKILMEMRLNEHPALKRLL